jgi:hypothetical protein
VFAEAAVAAVFLMQRLHFFLAGKIFTARLNQGKRVNITGIYKISSKHHSGVFAPHQ